VYDDVVPDAYERTLPEVFPDFAPGNFTWDPEMAAWVWTTFNDYQWDLNWGNPDVVCEFAEVMLFLANRGVDCLRLDAIAFLWKRMGTDCQNQPEVHGLTRALRAVARIAAPSLVFKAEAIVAPGDLVKYLGVGEFAGSVSDLAYHNSLMVQIWSALATKDAWLLVRALHRFPPSRLTARDLPGPRRHRSTRPTLRRLGREPPRACSQGSSATSLGFAARLRSTRPPATAGSAAAPRPVGIRRRGGGPAARPRQPAALRLRDRTARRDPAVHGRRARLLATRYVASRHADDNR
jgi:hypothetical protein